MVKEKLKEKQQVQELTKAELEVMKIIWKLEKAFVNEILDEMPEPKPAYNTVSTVVRILETKGVVGHETFGRSHRYFSLIAKDEYAETMMLGVMNNFFDNSFTQMFSFFSGKENLSLKEIEEVAALAQKIMKEKK